MMRDTNWVETCSIEDFCAAFPSWAWLPEDDADQVLRSVEHIMRDKLYRGEELSAMERALVAVWNDQPEMRRAVAKYMENIFLLDDGGWIPKESNLSITVGQMEKLVEQYRNDPARLEMLDQKLNCLIEHVQILVHCTEKPKERCEESAAYYRATMNRCQKMREQIGERRVLLADVSGKPKVQPETLQSLHDDPIFDLYELLRAGEKKKKIRELQTAAELECTYYHEPSVDLCDKWLLLGAQVADHHEETLKASRFVVDEKTLKVQNQPIANAISKEAVQLENTLSRLEEKAKKILDPQTKPSRFWRALAALVLCAGTAVASWRQPPWLLTALGDGYQLFYIVFGLAFAAGLLAKGILYGLLLCFCAGFGIFSAVTVSSIFMSGEPTLEETIFLTLGIGMAMCTLVLLWRTWSSRKTLGNTNKQRANLSADLKKLEHRAALCAECLLQLEEAASSQNAQRAAERYGQLKQKFRTVRNTAQKYL